MEWRAQHHQLRNKYSTLYRQLRNKHFQTTIGSYRHNPRALSKTINHVMGRSAHHLPPALPLQDLASNFSSLLYQPGTECNLPLGPVPQNGFSQFQPVTSKEVLELLKNLKPSKSPGPDQIRPSELKMVARRLPGL